MAEPVFFARTDRTDPNRRVGRTLLILNIFFRFHFYSKGVIGLCIALMGILINIFGIIFLARRKTLALFHKLIISLAIWDISVLIMITGCYILPTLSTNYYQNIFNPYYPYGLPIVQISVTGSIYSTLFLTIERYVVANNAA